MKTATNEALGATVGLLGLGVGLASYAVVCRLQGNLSLFTALGVSLIDAVCLLSSLSLHCP
jgi:hypothetical protein